MRIPCALAVAMLAFGCALVESGASPPNGSESPPVDPHASPADAASAEALPVCDEVAPITAPAEYYRDSPIYVANEMPADKLRVWASGKPGFQVLWIDRDRNGWLTLAFSQDAAARQAELETEFQDVGAVAVQVDWTMAQLEQLQRRVREQLGPEVAVGTSLSVTKGLVDVYIGALTDERMAAVEAAFAGERICLDGADPADVPSEGPQQQAGDGWRLLADADGVGPAYRTGIAYDEASYAELWSTAELASDRPAVDFQSQVAIWFGVVTGSICPPIRLDDVIVDRQSALVYPEIVQVGFGGCTDDIHPHAYVVALERSLLPAAPFSLQLGPDHVLPEERTVIEVDLSQPGAIARPGDVDRDRSPREPEPNGPGTIVEPGYAFRYRQSTHCGLQWLGPINDVYWRTAEADSSEWIPVEWQNAVDREEITLRTVIEQDQPPILRATAAGHTVVYEASPDDAPGCD